MRKREEEVSKQINCWLQQQNKLNQQRGRGENRERKEEKEGKEEKRGEIIQTFISK